MPAKVIGLINHKGGCGKTTTALNMSGLLAEWPSKRDAANKVLLIDMDPQGSANKCVLGDSDLDFSRDTLDQLLLATPPGRIPLDSCTVSSEWRGHLDFIPSNEDNMVTAHQSGMMQNHLNAVVVLRKLLKPVMDMYDYIVVDTGPTQGILMWNVLYAIDFAVIPTILDDINIQALPKTLNNLRRLEAEFDRKPTLLGILPTAFRQGVSNQEKFLVELRKKFGSGVFDPIPQTTDVQEAYAARLPLHRYNASSMAVKPYAAFTAEVMNRAA